MAAAHDRLGPARLDAARTRGQRLQGHDAVALALTTIHAIEAVQG